MRSRAYCMYAIAVCVLYTLTVMHTLTITTPSLSYAHPHFHHTLTVTQEAVECVKEMKSPGMLHVFVSEAIKYALENTSECRQLVGQLFHQLLQDGTLAVDRMVAG